KTICDLDSIDKLIIPGGESTTIGRLLEKTGLGQRIIELAEKGFPIYGTCAGAIILSKKIIGYEQYKLGLMDITIRRNAYGRQAESFEKNILIKCLSDKPYKCIFIRAPVIESASDNIEVLAKENDNIIMAKQKNILVTTFHPELTDDLRIHDYFLRM
ncbi:MAG TPA: pyridoxal 5'-phosphate synthase glutaminase subunit PdxT, partial [Candidatus Nanoarchaeia archaeon]|nr:pyridoxal 5'-phosphate synthase glutaminase subunit PdxT [Candidatus Nanoarchaeia archaeon]